MAIGKGYIPAAGTTDPARLADAIRQIHQNAVGSTDLASYLTSASAAATYLTIANAAATYLTSSSAASTYATLANLPFRGFQSFTSSGTFNAATNKIFVMLWAAGGGSGGNDGVNNGAGAGGGEFRMGLLSVTPSVDITVTIGAGGTAGTAAPTAGGTGGSSSLVQSGSTILGCVGGNPSGAATGGINGGAGGNGGSGGTFIVAGQTGMNNITNAGHGGGSFGFPGPWRSTAAVHPGTGAAGFQAATATVGLAGFRGQCLIWY